MTCDPDFMDDLKATSVRLNDELVKLVGKQTSPKDQIEKFVVAVALNLMHDKTDQQTELQQMERKLDELLAKVDSAEI